MRILAVLLTVTLAAETRPSLWRSPRNDWGGAAGAPVAPFRLLKEEKGGTTPKVWVRDRAGRTWIVKWGKEIHGDLFASRLLSALGYYAAPAYLVSRGRIVGASGAKGTRAESYVDRRGTFKPARFKLVDPRYQYVKAGWRWDENPFLRTAQGRRELNGLKIIMLLLSNWDAKDAREGSDGNTAIFLTKRGSQAIYAVDDWGASMGGWGGFFTRDKWDCNEYREQNGQFIKGIDDHGYIKWGYSGKHKDDLTKEISPADARWFLQQMKTISRTELMSALRASGTSPRERVCLFNSLTGRIRTLNQVARASGFRRIESAARR